VSERGDHHSPRPAGGPNGGEAARRVAQDGRSTIRRQNPTSRGRGTEGRCLGTASLHSGHLRGIGPEQGPGRILIPGDGAAGDQGAQNRPACPAMTVARHLRAVRLNDLLALRLRRTCRLVTGRSHRPRSTWPNQARLAPRRSRIAIIGHIVFGSNNFRSPNRSSLQLR
jgi:hypothetical protein